MKKKVQTAAVAAVLTLGTVMTAYAGQWIADGGNWWYRQDAYTRAALIYDESEE